MPPNKLFARLTIELRSESEPAGAMSAEMDQPTGAVAEIPAKPTEIQMIAMMILCVKMAPKK